MKILVTGASGFIGGSLVRRLARGKHRVIALVRESSDTSNIPSKVDIVYADLANEEQQGKVVKGVDVVYHCAAGSPHHKLSDEKYKAVNVDGTKNLLDVAVKRKIKHFIHISTVSIYDVEKDSNPSEKTKPNPTHIYAETKLAAEKEVLKYAKKGLKYTIIRPTLVFGPYDTRSGFFSLFKLIKKGMFIPIANNKIYLHTLYIGNLVDLLIKLPLNKKAINEDFIIGDIHCTTVDDFIDSVYKAANRPKPKFSLPLWSVNIAAFISTNIIGKLGGPTPINKKRLNFITKTKRYNVKKLQEVLDYKPKYTLSKAIEHTYDWYIKNELI